MINKRNYDLTHRKKVKEFVGGFLVGGCGERWIFLGNSILKIREV
jgi:hypothetical protein